MRCMGKLDTKREEILELYIHDQISQKDIANRLQVNQSSISRIIKKSGKKRKRIIYTPGLHIKGRFWRYHALHFVVKPYYFYPRYSKIRKTKGNYGITRKDWIVKLHETTVELQLRKGVDFANKNKYKATDMAQESLNRNLISISNEFGFEVWKERKCAIRLVREHLSDVRNPLANKRNGNPIQIRGSDGFVWLLIDKSKGEPELETVKANSALSDSDVIDKFMNDWKENDPPTNSELAIHITAMLGIQEEFNKNIVLHMNILKRMGTALGGLEKGVKEMVKTINKIGEKLK